MKLNKDLAGVLYIDGHERVYNGSKNKPPRRFISRLRLALRGSTDYWVCDRIGQPFFSVNTTVNGSMIETIKEEIIPRLEKDVPDQPSKTELDANPLLHKFMIVYDRECYSNDFILDNWEKRVAICTYDKFVKEKWAEEEFCEYEIIDDNGDTQKIKMAERAILIEGKETEKLEKPELFIQIKQTEGGGEVKITKKLTKKKRQLWIREVRKLQEDGHQTSILTTNYMLPLLTIGVFMFARWCQENFFKYMMKNFGLDMLVSYLTQKMSDTQMVINPLWRTLDKQVRSLQTKLNRKKAKFGELTYNKELSDKELLDQDIEKYKQKKAELEEDISVRNEELEELKIKRKGIERKILFSQLPEEEKFDSVYSESKQFVDTIKLVAYRAETTMVNTIAKYMNKPKTARSLIAQILKSNADYKVDDVNKILEVKIHNQPRHADNKILKKLCEELNSTEIIFPQTDLKIVYSLLSED